MSENGFFYILQRRQCSGDWTAFCRAETEDEVIGLLDEWSKKREPRRYGWVEWRAVKVDTTITELGSRMAS